MNSPLTLVEACPKRKLTLTYLALAFVGLKNKLAKIQEEIYRKKKVTGEDFGGLEIIFLLYRGRDREKGNLWKSKQI